MTFDFSAVLVLVSVFRTDHSGEATAAPRCRVAPGLTLSHAQAMTTDLSGFRVAVIRFSDDNGSVGNTGFKMSAVVCRRSGSLVVCVSSENVSGSQLTGLS